MEFNNKIFHLINGIAHKNVLLDIIMKGFSEYIPIVFMALFCFLYLYGLYKNNKEFRFGIVSTFICTVINLFISYLIGLVYFVPRPFVNNNVNLLLPHVSDASFPSDHATGTMSIALGVTRINKLLGKILIVMSIIVGISRVYVGHHYPLDVIGGYLLAGITNYLYKRFLIHKMSEIYSLIDSKVFSLLKDKKILSIEE